MLELEMVAYAIRPRFVASLGVIKRLHRALDWALIVSSPVYHYRGSSGHKILTGAPDITLDINRDITPYESSAWVPRIEQASKAVTDYLRHGFDENKFNMHSTDGYVRVAMLVQLPQFKKWNINEDS